ncbi:uncharacterized protein LOC108039389 [Drosophila rhopaloa]|uniref:Uncharacterized protein LOC108039389 n=1 Tax=Drosophila rhopaloa TaxID=1041015 RepID=A0A6P4EEY6_DRORH|nr:uncharacterized protein LOC108039389 [Drosophila rhopaloa]
MSKSMPFARESHTPNIGRYTNSRTLQSVYSKLPPVMGGQRGASEVFVAGAMSARVKGVHLGAHDPVRVWNCNKPKMAKPANKTYNVYAKQKTSSVGKDAPKAIVKRWVHPPTPDHRPKEDKNKGGRPCNYESFYVPFEQDGSAKAEPLVGAFFVPLDDNREMPQQRRQKTKPVNLAEAKAKGFNAANRQHGPENKAAKRVCNFGMHSDRDQLLFSKFQQLRPAGERFVLKTGEMVALIAEIKSRQGKANEQMTVESVPPLPPPPQFAEDPKESRKRLLLHRCRTQTLFSTSDCDESLYKYACHLPFVRDPAHPDVFRPRLNRFSSRQ